MNGSYDDKTTKPLGGLRPSPAAKLTLQPHTPSALEQEGQRNTRGAEHTLQPKKKAKTTTNKLHETQGSNPASADNRTLQGYLQSSKK